MRARDYEAEALAIAVDEATQRSLEEYQRASVEQQERDADLIEIGKLTVAERVAYQAWGSPDPCTSRNGCEDYNRAGEARNKAVDAYQAKWGAK